MTVDTRHYAWISFEYGFLMVSMQAVESAWPMQVRQRAAIGMDSQTLRQFSHMLLAMSDVQTVILVLADRLQVCLLSGCLQRQQSCPHAGQSIRAESCMCDEQRMHHLQLKCLPCASVGLLTCS